MEKIYKKLIRDKVPQIMEAKGLIFETKILNEKEYQKALIEKLKEEMQELLDAKEDSFLEEMADVMEVLRALLKMKGKTILHLEEMRKEKYEKNGGFEKKIFLEKVKNAI